MPALLFQLLQLMAAFCRVSMQQLRLMSGWQVHCVLVLWLHLLLQHAVRMAEAMAGHCIIAPHGLQHGVCT